MVPVRAKARRVRELVHGAPNKRKHERACKELSLTSREPTLTSKTFRGEDTSQFIDACIRETTASRAIDDVWSHHASWGGTYHGAYDYWDAAFLFGLIRKTGTRRVVEFSPNEGWSTLFMRLAADLESHWSFDIVDYEEAIRKGLRDHGVEGNWKFVLGDVQQTILENPKLLAEADLIFIDSDHSREFAAWYTEELRLFEKAKPGCLIHVHDVYPMGLERPEFGESPYILDFVCKNRDRFDVIHNYEIARSQHFQSLYPKRFFVGHSGEQAANPSIWLEKKS